MWVGGWGGWGWVGGGGGGERGSQLRSGALSGTLLKSFRAVPGPFWNVPGSSRGHPAVFSRRISHARTGRRFLFHRDCVTFAMFCFMGHHGDHLHQCPEVSSSTKPSTSCQFDVRTPQVCVTLRVWPTEALFPRLVSSGVRAMSQGDC